MEITIHADIRKLDTDYKKALDEYIKRTSPYCKITLKTYKKFSALSLRDSSAKVAIIPGKNTISSPELADTITNYNLNGISHIEFIVPSSSEYETDDSWSTMNISSFSLNTELTVVVLAEQLYRAYTILNNITYHK